MLNVPMLPEFDAAARAVLRFLRERVGFDLWMVTRVQGDDWIVLQAEDHGYSVAEGTVFRWSDSFCSRMVRGLGPCIAPRSADVPAFAEAPIGRLVKVGAYIGVPLYCEDGTLFGTVCAIDPAAQPESLVAELPMVELLAGLLGTIMNADMKTGIERRRAERAEAEALSDALTGIYNRRGWDQLVAAEESRCRRFGIPACVVSIDLDGLKTINDGRGHLAGDDLIRRTANALREALREQDVLARYGGDEFMVLGVECDSSSAIALVQRVETALRLNRIDASVGYALRDPNFGLKGAMIVADLVMYADKKSRGFPCQSAAAGDSDGRDIGVVEFHMASSSSETLVAAGMLG